MLNDSWEWHTSILEKCFTAHENFLIFICTFFKSFQISWIRYKDTSLLTVGRYTYTTDLRFEAFHSPHTDDWVVRLKNPRPSDSGIYGCQISTTPHRTQLVYLTVHGKRPLYKLGTILLKCFCSLVAFWYSTWIQSSQIFSKYLHDGCICPDAYICNTK